MEEDSHHKYTNDLIHETSPYLLQHAHNPVNWHAWNEETLIKAKKADKPLLVSIGYAACHWCHVMEHESFENEEIAAIMNEHFICIKVDREERPDVDQYYMSAANLITGGGGWPLNCFALPDGRVFHAGTYFRPNDWSRLLVMVANEYKNKREELSEFADQVAGGIRQNQMIRDSDSSESLNADVVHRSVLNWMQRIDTINGGPDRAPKFPLPDNYLFLMQYAHQFKNEQVWNHVERTLYKMGEGGIYDQVGGGFCRYSVDGIWKVPHFEKMLYDNAQLTSLYATAFKKTKNPFYLEIATQTAEFCMRELLSDEGVFYSSLDADSEGEEGKFYTWTNEELVETLGEHIDLARLYFKLNKQGQWEEKFILMRNLPENTIREEMAWSEHEYQNNVQAMMSKLFRKREQRIRPGLDDKSLTSWNALMIIGLVDLYEASGDEKYLDQARKTLSFLLDRQLKDGLLYHNYKGGRTTIPGFLEDYSFLIAALMKVNEVDPGAGDLDLANNLASLTIEKFYHREQKTFQFTPVNSEELNVAPVEVMDNVIPSSMAVMVNNLRKLYLVADNGEYALIYQDLLQRVAPRVVSYGSGFSHWMQVILDETGSSFEVVVIGEKAAEQAVNLARNYIPGTLLVTATKANELLIFKGRYKEGKTLIYTCKNRACRMPVERTAEVMELLTGPSSSL